jgi:hypothetical protein
MGASTWQQSGEIIVGADALIDFGWDEPDPLDPTGQDRRPKNISGDTVTFNARLKLGQNPILTKTSAIVGQINITDVAGEVQADGTILHGQVVIADTDLVGLISSDTDLYCTFTLLTNEGETDKTGVRIRARVVE